MGPLANTSHNMMELLPENLPEVITISKLQKTMKPVDFPHLAIILKLIEDMSQNKLANAFHGGRLVVCAGCHHNSPIGETPPPCSTCHSDTGERSDVNTPTLMGALHRNCLECHKRMEINDYIMCSSCHSDWTAVSGNEGEVPR